jgi:hypothetical protein
VCCKTFIGRVSNTFDLGSSDRTKTDIRIIQRILKFRYNVKLSSCSNEICACFIWNSWLREEMLNSPEENGR